MKKVVIIGASVGGLVAAAKLKKAGVNVTILEKGNSVGGLFSKVSTPFGVYELGMHVLYVTEEQHALISEMFGSDVFIAKTGFETDIGGCFNNGTLYTNSIYPDVRALPSRDLIYSQILKRGTACKTVSATDELQQRFGVEAAQNVVAPILQKLWGKETDELSSEAIHCFFDLRRIVLADKPESDKLKSNPVLDSVLGNPVQAQPAGDVFGGRKALFFKNGIHGFSERILNYLKEKEINIFLGSDVQLINNKLVSNSSPLIESYDACILASPLNALDKSLFKVLDCIELSIFYYKVERRPQNRTPVYYVLCHSEKLISSRIVDYSAYNFDHVTHLDQVLAVEVLHEVGKRPDEKIIGLELAQVLPNIEIIEGFTYPHSLRIASPTLNNSRILDEKINLLKQNFQNDSIYFVGMRTDKGVFFSHQTIGAAYEAALECIERFS